MKYFNNIIANTKKNNISLLHFGQYDNCINKKQNFIVLSEKIK